ncbi:MULTISPECIES: WGxxGxxG family protein [Cyanophyceae]|uniref:WGxxGxxG family protein n=1 Tax=Cyanophyceae TaxID=3028117 RepID=UPI0016876D44|nr:MULTISPECIES: WGxxGxxG family protein [Cyanophyceae]MBD1914693.1 WGxxGxxG-CTERM domain-containing protein [Phormidium sp. FACHB-77]MBD2032581.1 WGxxGxxG-CTERM domain-containing protein [Phormidium sp. FACHB-322]MBD2049439.1 WGxxGxxG-CTERM domain-containing protein [Leptolyngbya sp. FACHB-60]
MKNKSLATWLGTGALAVSLAVLPSILPASAQTTTGSDGVGTTTTDGIGTTTTTNDNNDGFDWGWLGLIGLAGLAGLKGKDRDNDNRVSYADRTTTTSTNNPRY